MNNSVRKPLSPLDSSKQQNTEAMLLQRLESTTTEDDYFRWLLFTVGYYRGVDRAQAAKDLLQRFAAGVKSSDYTIYQRRADLSPPGDD